MKRSSTTLFLLFVLLNLPVYAQTPDPAVPELSWLSGYWTSNDNGATTEELWTHGAGYMMLGLHRDVSANGRSSFEYLRIVQTRDGLAYVASPNGGSSTSFALKEHGNQRVVFENPEHDFPQRIIYSRQGDKLTARIEGGEGENLQHMEWTWTKTKSTF